LRRDRPIAELPDEAFRADGAVRRSLDQRRPVPAIVVVAGPLLIHSLAVEEHDDAAPPRFLEETRIGQGRKTAERLVLRVGDRGGEGGHLRRLPTAVDRRGLRPAARRAPPTGSRRAGAASARASRAPTAARRSAGPRSRT